MDKDGFNQRLGERIRTLRRQGKMTLAELGSEPALSLSGTSISNVEAGRQQITAYQLFCFAAALGTSVSELLAGVAVAGDKPVSISSKKMKTIIKEL